MATNRPHFHIWKAAKPRKPGQAPSAMFRQVRAFHTAQAASQFMRRREPDKSKWTVQKCECPECRPDLD